MRSLIIALALVGSGAFSHAAAPTKTAAPPAETVSRDPQVQPNAMRLAQLTNPGDEMAEAELREFDRLFVPMLRDNKDVAAMEAEYPGLLDAVHRAARPLVVSYMRKDVPHLQADIAKLYASRFSAKELDDLIGFYESPTGQKLIRGMIANQNARGVAEEYVKTGKFGIESLEAQKFLALSKTMSDFGPRDQETLLAFTKLSAFPKLAAMRQEIMRVLQTWMNRPTPEYDQEMDEVMGKAMEAHISASSGKSR